MLFHDFIPDARPYWDIRRKMRKMDLLSEYGNKHVMLSESNTNSIERELDSIINGSGGQQDTQSLANRENSSLSELS